MLAAEVARADWQKVMREPWKNRCEPAIRVDPLSATRDLLDFNSSQVSTPEYELLLRLERERRIHLDLGLEREASGIGFAMLTIWQLATSRTANVDILLDVDPTLPLAV